MQVTEKLKAYYTFYQQLKDNGGPEENVDLFEEVVHLEEEIMAAYGLPPSHQHLHILWELTNAEAFTDEVVQETQQQLQEAATQHLMAPVKTNLEVLQEAQAEKHSAFNVLPEIGQPTHDYPLFLYEELLLKGKNTPQEILQELEKVKELDCYGEVATLLYRHRKSFKRTKIYKQLRPHLKFLDTYLLQLRALGQSEDNSFFVSSLLPPGEQELLQALAAPDLPPSPSADAYQPTSVVLAGAFEMEELVYSPDSAVTVNGLLHAGSSPTSISLGFEMDDLLDLLGKYSEPGAYIRALIQQENPFPQPEEPEVISLRDSLGNTLLIDQHYFKVYKPLVIGEDGSQEVMAEEFYLVEEVLGKSDYDAQQRETSQQSLQALFFHLSTWYQTYLEFLKEGTSEEESRRKCGLHDQTLFELARHLYTLEHHGGSTDFIS